MGHSLHSLRIEFTVIVTVSCAIQLAKFLAHTMIKRNHPSSKPYDFSKLIFNFCPYTDMKMALISLYSSGNWIDTDL